MQVFSINQASFNGRSCKNLRKAKKLLERQKANNFNKQREIKASQPKILKNETVPVSEQIKQEPAKPLQDNEIKFVGMLQTLEEFSKRLNLKW